MDLSHDVSLPGKVVSPTKLNIWRFPKSHGGTPSYHPFWIRMFHYNTINHPFGMFSVMKSPYLKWLQLCLKHRIATACNKFHALSFPTNFHVFHMEISGNVGKTKTNHPQFHHFLGGMFAIPSHGCFMTL